MLHLSITYILSTQGGSLSFSCSPVPSKVAYVGPLSGINQLKYIDIHVMFPTPFCLFCSVLVPDP